MGNLSRDFSRHEFECRCCGGLRYISPILIAALQALRDLAGVPIHIASGYRCIEHNKDVGGARNSQHMLGTAADLGLPGVGLLEAYRLAEQIPAFAAGGIGIYPDAGFLHVDVRRGTARWGKVTGRYVSAEEALNHVKA